MTVETRRQVKHNKHQPIDTLRSHQVTEADQLAREPDLPWMRVLDFLLPVEQTTDRETFYSAIMDGMPKLVPLDVGVSCLSAERGRPQCVAFNRGFEIKADFSDYYWRRMPFPPERTLSMHQTDYREWEHTEYVTDFIRPSRIWHKMAIPSPSFSVALYRSRADGPSSDLEAAILRTVGPHLESLYRRFLPECGPRAAQMT